VSQGGTVTVELGTNDCGVEVNVAGTAESTFHPADSSKNVDVPVPNVAPGTLVYLVIGSGLGARILVVEVVAPLR
jgi:hypothetical protein